MTTTTRLAGRGPRQNGKVCRRQHGSRTQILDADEPRSLVLVIHEARKTRRLRARRRRRIRVELARQALLQGLHVAAFEVSRPPEAREADRARNAARRTAAANQAASSALPGGPDHRHPPRGRRAGPPRSSAWSCERPGRTAFTLTYTFQPFAFRCREPRLEARAGRSRHWHHPLRDISRSDTS